MKIPSPSRRALFGSLMSIPFAAHLSQARAATPRCNTTADPGCATRYRSVGIDGMAMFYREAGLAGKPVILLLHGYPSSSRMFEPLFALLSDRYHLIAPDYPGFGLSDAPDRSSYRYTFDQLARTVASFTEALGLTRYHLYVQDYGGPIGLRLATTHPERIASLIVQNAVMHEEGLTQAWAVRRAYWNDRDSHERTIRDGMYSVQAGIDRHLGRRAAAELYDPDLWMDEIAYLRRPGIEAIQLDLAFDYQSNVLAYPRWQAYLRQYRPPVLVVWGKHDPLFSVRGATAIQRELPSSLVHFLNAGHFALDDAADEIGEHIRAFIG